VPDSADLEIEIKLAGAEKELRGAFRALSGRAKSAHVVSRYFDTAEDRLWQKGYTLRLREKSGGHELTLKSEGGDRIIRGEWSALLDDPIADPGRLPGTAPRGEIGLLLPEELKERHRTDVTRSRKTVTAGAAEIEASLDLGGIVSGDWTMPVAELELELVRGETRDVLELAQKLAMRHGLTLEARSKAARGMELAQAKPPDWHKAGKPGLDPAQTVPQAIATILATTAQQIMANIAAARDGRDIEGVHQLRVALRRLRSAFSIFGDRLGPELDPLSELARRALRSLGPARDIDVFIDETLPPLNRAMPEARGLGRLAELAAAQRSAAYEDVRQLCDGSALGGFVLRVLLLADEMAGRDDEGVALTAFAARVLKKRRKKALKMGAGFETLSTPERHEVRIAVKKLRYAVDFFQQLYPEDAVSPFQSRLKLLQDDFGTLNDAAVAAELADQLADGDVEALIGAATARGWYAHRLKAVEPHMIEAWNGFRRAEPFWK
jgi:inorganic triphosphatase YgiF